MIEYIRPVADYNGSKVQKNIYYINISLDSIRETEKEAFHDSIFLKNHGIDTLNTHIPWILIKLRTPVLYKFDWFYSDPKGLGSLYWNIKLENWFKNAISRKCKGGGILVS